MAPAGGRRAATPPDHAGKAAQIAALGVEYLYINIPAPECPNATACTGAARSLGQREHLPRIDQIGITDRRAVGVEYLNIQHPGPVIFPRDAP